MQRHRACAMTTLPKVLAGRLGSGSTWTGIPDRVFISRNHVARFR